MPKLPMTQFKGLELKPGDRVQLVVAAIGNGEVQFEYVDPKDAPLPKQADYLESKVEEDDTEDEKEDDGIKQPEKPLTEKDDPSKMDLKELRSRLPVKEEE